MLMRTSHRIRRSLNEPVAMKKKNVLNLKDTLKPRMSVND